MIHKPVCLYISNGKMTKIPNTKNTKLRSYCPFSSLDKNEKKTPISKAIQSNRPILQVLEASPNLPNSASTLYTPSANNNKKINTFSFSDLDENLIILYP